MALNQLGLGFVFTAKDLASGVIGRVENAFGGLEDKAAEAAQSFIDSQTRLRNMGLAIAGAGVAVIGTAAALAVQAAHFEDAIARAGARAGLAADEMDRFHDAAFEVTATIRGFSAEEAARTLKTLAEEGLSAADSLKVLRPTLLFATATGMEAAVAAGFFSDVLSAFNISAADAGGAADRMAFAMRRFGIASQELQPLLFGVARGASLAGASFDDALLAVGLAKSVLPEAGQAAAAANLAMLQLADPSIAGKLRTQGVAVTDASGRMRPLIDILGELAERTEGMTEARRAATIADIFGGRAAGGMAVIMNQLSNGVRDAADNVVRGAAAVELLRREMAGAAGTAEEMSDRVLGTLSGQMRELRAAFSTLATALGELFVPIFKPIVKAIADFARMVATAIGRMPPGLKRVLGSVVLAVGAFLTLVGGLIAAKASIALFAVALKAAGVTLAGIAGAVLPVVAVVGLLALAAVALKSAWERSLGGIRDFVERLWGRVRLFFQAMSQLFSEGGFSGAVMEELGRAENSGVKQFAIRVFQILFRVRRFFEGIAEGFGAAIEAARPVLEAFVGALQRLGQALGLVSMAGADAAAGIPSGEFAAFGRVIGTIAGILVDVFVGALTFVVEVVSTAIDVFRQAIEPLSPIFDGVKEAISLVWAELQKLGAMFGITSGQGQQAGGTMGALSTIVQFLGFVIGNVAAFIAGAIGLMVQFVVRRLGIVIAAFRAVVGFIQGVIDILAGIVTGDWARVWTGFKNVVLNVLNFLAQLVLGFVEMVASVIDSIAGIFGADFGAAEAIRGLREDIERGLLGGVEVATAGVEVRPTAVSGAAVPGAATAAFPAGTVAEAQFAALERAAGGAPPVHVESPPVTTNVQLTVDGEVLARAVARAERGGAARSFVPVPVGG